MLAALVLVAVTVVVILVIGMAVLAITYRISRITFATTALRRPWPIRSFDAQGRPVLQIPTTQTYVACPDQSCFRGGVSRSDLITLGSTGVDFHRFRYASPWAGEHVPYSRIQHVDVPDWVGGHWLVLRLDDQTDVRFVVASHPALGAAVHALSRHCRLTSAAGRWV